MKKSQHIKRTVAKVMMLALTISFLVLLPLSASAMERNLQEELAKVLDAETLALIDFDSLSNSAMYVPARNTFDLRQLPNLDMFGISAASSNLRGDVNGDGRIDVADWNLLNAFLDAPDRIAFMIRNPQFRIANADLDGDFDITDTDVEILETRYLSGIMQSLSVFTGNSLTRQVPAGGIVTINFPPVPGIIFKGWIIVAGGPFNLQTNNPNNPTATFTMPNRDVTIFGGFIPHIPGDVNGDGRRCQMDIELLFRRVNSMCAYTFREMMGNGFFEGNADVDGNGIVNMSDVTLLRLVVNGIVILGANEYLCTDAISALYDIHFANDCLSFALGLELLVDADEELAYLIFESNEIAIDCCSEIPASDHDYSVCSYVINYSGCVENIIDSYTPDSILHDGSCSEIPASDHDYSVYSYVMNYSGCVENIIDSYTPDSVLHDGIVSDCEFSDFAVVADYGSATYCTLYQG